MANTLKTLFGLLLKALIFVRDLCLFIAQVITVLVLFFWLVFEPQKFLVVLFILSGPIAIWVLIQLDMARMDLVDYLQSRKKK